MSKKTQEKKFLKKIKKARSSELIACITELKEQRNQLDEMIGKIDEELKRRKQ